MSTIDGFAWNDIIGMWLWIKSKGFTDQLFHNGNGNEFFLTFGHDKGQTIFKDR